MSDMEDYYGDDDFGDLLGDAFDYFYVEDAYHAADDLAEHSVPSPPPYDSDDEWDDHSRFDYWYDIEYDSDAGWQDVEGRKKRKEGLEKQASVAAGSKRKAGKAPLPVSKKRKTAVGARRGPTERSPSPTPTVLWRTAQDRNRLSPPAPRVLNKKDEQPWALLKDWKERFANHPGFPTAREHDAGAELEDALAEAESRLDDEDSDEASSSKERKASKAAGSASQQGLEELLGSSGPDMEALRFALQQGMAKIGVDASGMDESKLLSFAARMLSDQDAGDDIIDELAEDLLGDEEDEEEGEGGFSHWVQQRAEASASSKDGKASSSTAKGRPVLEDEDMLVPQLSPSPPLPAMTANHPPTPASTETNSSQNSGNILGGRPSFSPRTTNILVPSLRGGEGSIIPSFLTKATTPNSKTTTPRSTRKQKDGSTKTNTGSPAPPSPKRGSASPIKNARKRRAEDADVENVQPEGNARGSKRLASYARPTKASVAKNTNGSGAGPSKAGGKK